MAHIVSKATKQQLIAALERNETVIARASTSKEETGNIADLLKKYETIAVTNHQKSFYAHLSLNPKGNIKVQ